MLRVVRVRSTLVLIVRNTLYQVAKVYTISKEAYRGLGFYFLGSSPYNPS
jgi:hypothetical protein